MNPRLCSCLIIPIRTHLFLYRYYLCTISFVDVLHHHDFQLLSVQNQPCYLADWFLYYLASLELMNSTLRSTLTSARAYFFWWPFDDTVGSLSAKASNRRGIHYRFLD